MSMHDIVTYKLEKDKLTCIIAGRLDSVVSEIIEEDLFDHVQEAKCTTIFDFKEVEYVSSAFLRVSIKVARATPSMKITIINALPVIKEVYEMTKQISKEHGYLKDQIRRSATSISLNIAKGNGRFHIKDRRNMFVIARGSCFECVPSVELLLRYELITLSKYKILRDKLEIIGKMLSGFIRSSC